MCSRGKPIAALAAAAAASASGGAGGAGGAVAASLPPLHPALTRIAPLVGEWHGKGEGIYPTIPSFRYAEQLSFTHGGKPFLAYSQKTREIKADGSMGLPLHVESGYIRATPDGAIEMVVSDPTGQAEVFVAEFAEADEGTLLDITFKTTTVVRTPAAKAVDAVHRRIRVSQGGDGSRPRLSYELDMAAVGQEMQRHLTAELTKQLPLLASVEDFRSKASSADYGILDVREPAEVAGNPVTAEGVVCIPMGQVIHKAGTSSLPALDSLAERRLTYVICDTGVRAAMVVGVLREIGHQSQVVDGGIVALQAEDGGSAGGPSV